MEIVRKKEKSKEIVKYYAVLGLIIFALVLEIFMSILILSSHKLVVEEPVFKKALFFIVFVGTIFSLYSHIAAARKIAIKIIVFSDTIEIVTAGIFPIKSTYSIEDLRIDRFQKQSTDNVIFVKINNLKGELLFGCSSDLFDVEELLDSESSFLQGLGKTLLP